MELETGSKTPWGPALDVTRIDEGIWFVDTLSHGGYYVSPSRASEMPARLRIADGWYEQDYDWARVCIAFPAYFPGSALPEAKMLTRGL